MKSAVEETAKDQAAAVDAKVKEEAAKVTETVEKANESSKEKAKKSSLFALCFSKPATKDDENLSEKPTVQNEAEPIDLTDKIKEAEKEIENTKNELAKLSAASEKLPEIIEEPNEAADTTAKTQESAPVSKPTRSN